jgi:hypothetical protein
MQLLRTFMVFLVGAGIAIGAHFAGWLNDLPRYLQSAAREQSPPYGGQAYEASAASPGPSDPDIGGGPDGIAEGPQESSVPGVPTALRVYYSPSRGPTDDRVCPPDYVVFNRTGRVLMFSEADEAGYSRGPEGARDVRINPGASLAPPGYAWDRASDREPDAGPCHSGIVRIVMDGE